MVYFEDETIDCVNKCGEWNWSGGKIKWLGYVPDVCRTCLDNPTMRNIVLDCQNKDCTNQFDYPPRWQKSKERKGHSQPALCETCRTANDEQQPVPIVCEACDIDYTYSRRYIISWKREEGWWEKRPVLCMPCFKDPERAEKLKKKKEEREKRKQKKTKGFRFEDTVGYYLLRYGKGQFDSIVDQETYGVTSNVQTYDVLTDVTMYESLVETPKNLPSLTAAEHIMEGLDRTGHGWDGLSFSEVLSNACYMAQDTSDQVIECEDTRSHYIVKYDTSEGAVTIICYNKPGNPPYRVKSSFMPPQKEAAQNIIDGHSGSGGWMLK